MSMIKEFAEKLIERLEEKAEINSELGYMTAYDVTKECIAIVKQQAEKLSPLYSLENLTSWIPCDERLPEYNALSEYYESVIVTLDDGRVVDGCYRNKDKEWWVDAADGEHYSINATGHVIAWMPLPDPYRGKEER